MNSVYLILAERDDLKQQKIGVSNNVNKRYKEIKTANPNLIRIETTYKSEYAYSIETLLKKFLKQSQIDGEQFLYESINKEKFLQSCELYHTNFDIIKNKNKYQL